MIVTANQFFRTSWQAYETAAITLGLVRQGLPLLKLVAEDNPVQVEINHGRWIAKCECGGAELVWEEGMFMCQSCWNGKHQHKYRLVVMPQNRKAIEDELDKRPLQNRNWDNGETITSLKVENEAHKSELLEVQ